MISGILTGTPIWVWPLFFVLLFVGYKASKPRKVSVILFYFLPLFGLVPINSVLQLPLQSFAWTSFGIGYGLGIFAGYRLQNRWLLGKEGRLISLSGEWFTMLVLMVIFWMNFVSGMMQAISYEIYSSAGFIGLFAGLVGAASGSFMGRALKMLRYSHS